MAQDLFLADDVEKIIVETDEENPTPIVTIDKSETPIKTDDSYRVRIQFKEQAKERKEERMELKILGSTYQVDFVNSISQEKLQIGETDYLNQRIKILSGLHADLEKVTLIHEILHIIFDQLEFDVENSEHLVQSLATALYQVFNENKIL